MVSVQLLSTSSFVTASRVQFLAVHSLEALLVASRIDELPDDEDEDDVDAHSLGAAGTGTGNSTVDAVDANADADAGADAVRGVERGVSRGDPGAVIATGDEEAGRDDDDELEKLEKEEDEDEDKLPRTCCAAQA